MATTTLGVKLDDPTRERLKAAATSIDRTPHWLIKQAIFNYLEKLEGGATLSELNGLSSKEADDAGEVQARHLHADRSPDPGREHVHPRLDRHRERVLEARELEALLHLAL